MEIVVDDDQDGLERSVNNEDPHTQVTAADRRIASPSSALRFQVDRWVRMIPYYLSLYLSEYRALQCLKLRMYHIRRRTDAFYRFEAYVKSVETTTLLRE